MTELYHGVETTRGKFVVSHEGTSEYKWQYAVKKGKFFDFKAHQAILSRRR